ncbi:MAG: T9SS type A sorting domain-containing protein, partial [Flavobacteriales bacterium]|nr:T9SS type A sorting domain-containing protein [Flavobacteriales bacterium]
DNESNGSQAFGGANWNNKLISLRNSLFSNNNAGTEGADFYTNASQGVSTSQGFNLFEDTLFSSITFAAGDFIGKDTLEALSYNGNAFTQTHGLRCNSFAVNAGDSTGLVDTLDQTERSRIVGSSVDIGAFELQSDLIAPIIAMNGLNLSVSRLGSYQWYKDGVLLLNDTNASLTVSANGNYYVSVLDPAGCLLNSDTVSILTVGIIENQISEISVYPNPVMDILNIQSNETMQLVNIYNAMGKNVLSSSVQSNNQAQINVAHLSFGIYFVEAEFLPNQKPIHFKFVKK